MKLLLDQGLPRSPAVLLRSASIEAVHTSEVGLSQAEDQQILSVAADEDRIVVTLDADFHSHLALSQATKSSVIPIRIEGLQADEVVALLRTVLRDCDDDLAAGAVISIQQQRIRIRRLPLT